VAEEALPRLAVSAVVDAEAVPAGALRPDADRLGRRALGLDPARDGDARAAAHAQLDAGLDPQSRSFRHRDLAGDEVRVRLRLEGGDAGEGAAELGAADRGRQVENEERCEVDLMGSHATPFPRRAEKRPMIRVREALGHRLENGDGDRGGGTGGGRGRGGYRDGGGDGDRKREPITLEARSGALRVSRGFARGLVHTHRTTGA